MKRTVLATIVVALLTLVFAQASGDTGIYRDSTAELLSVNDVTIPGTDIIARLDTCSLDENDTVSAIKSYVSVVLTVAKAIGKTVLKVIAGLIQSVV
ncbi:MAG: hypothetical protein JSW58_10870 [Candidatus Latescibacterota bacterium]|nr:MAG: hypothetical protein JSW58_10870 [Candidatus Latescibacterota bacterium]